MELTEFDKKVYNLYLSSVWRQQGKPYTTRKDWDGFEKDYKFPLLKTISSMLAKNPHLMCAEFFQAPYKVLDPEKYYGLEFFATMKSVGAYSTYMRSLEDREPDQQFKFFKDSLLFIYEFCKDRKITLEDYPFYKSVALNDCFKHIKNHKVSPYIAFALPGLYSAIINMDSDIHHLYFGDMNILDLQRKYERSVKTKMFLQACLEKMSAKLKKLVESL